MSGICVLEYRSIDVDTCAYLSLMLSQEPTHGTRFELRVHKRVIDLHSPSEVVKQITLSLLNPVLRLSSPSLMFRQTLEALLDVLCIEMYFRIADLRYDIKGYFV